MLSTNSYYYKSALSSTKNQERRCIFLNFWQVFTKLCNAHGESATCVLSKLELSKGNANRWKNGGGPTLATAVKIAQYFNITLDELIAEKNGKE